MNQNEAVFRDAPVRTAVVRMAVPTVISSLVLVIYNMADTFFVGQTHDAMQVAAVSLTNPVFVMFMAIATVLLNNALVQYGDDPVAAMGIVTKAYLFIVFIHMGITNGIQPLLATASAPDCAAAFWISSNLAVF